MNSISSCISDEVLCEYIDGTLPENEKQAVEAHISHCEPCCDAAREIRIGREAAGSAAPPFPKELHGRLASIPTTEHRRKRRMLQTFAALASCFVIAAGVLAGRFLFQNTPMAMQKEASANDDYANKSDAVNGDKAGDLPLINEDAEGMPAETRITCKGITAAALARRLHDGGGPEPVEQTDGVLYFQTEQLNALTAFLESNAVVWDMADSNEPHGSLFAVYFE